MQPCYERIVHVTHDDPVASVWSVESFLSREAADALLDLGVNHLPLVTEPVVRLYGRDCISHRRVGFFSHDADGYRFSGQKATASVPPTSLDILRQRVNQYLDTAFNGVLVNVYRDGSDYIGSHADDERELDRGTVAAISVGSERTFRMRDHRTGRIVVDITTTHGQLLVMDGAAQKVWKHDVPPRKRVREPRVSYTMRMHST